MSAQYALNVAETYSYQQPSRQQYMGNGFMNPPQPPYPYANGYTGPGPFSQLIMSNSQYPQYQSPIHSPQLPPYGGMPYGGFSCQYQMNMGAGYQGAPMNIPHFGGNPTEKPVYFHTNAPNPYFQLGSGNATQPIGMYNAYGQNVFYNPAPQDQVIHVPGIFGQNQYLLPSDAEEKCDKLQAEMIKAMDEAYEKRQQRMQGYYNMNGYNYYGMPYNNWFDSNIYAQYQQKIMEMAVEAEEKRRNLNKRLYGCAASVLGLEFDPDQFDMMMNGYDYVIPGSTIQESKQQERFARVVEYDPAVPYRKADYEVSQFYQQFNQSKNMNDWLRTDCALLIQASKLEEQFHRNRNLSGNYNRDTYRTYLRKYAQEQNLQQKEAEIKQRQESVFNEIKNGNYTNLPKTREEALALMLGTTGANDVIDRVNKLNEIASSDNPIEASRGFLIPTGPPNALGTPVVISDEIEQEYNMRRNAFVDSVMNPGKVGG